MYSYSARFVSVHPRSRRTLLNYAWRRDAVCGVPEQQHFFFFSTTARLRAQVPLDTRPVIRRCLRWWKGLFISPSASKATASSMHSPITMTERWMPALSVSKHSHTRHPWHNYTPPTGSTPPPPRSCVRQCGRTPWVICLTRLGRLELLLLLLLEKTAPPLPGPKLNGQLHYYQLWKVTEYKYLVTVLKQIFSSICTLLEFSFTFTPCIYSQICGLSAPRIGKTCLLLFHKFQVFIVVVVWSGAIWTICRLCTFTEVQNAKCFWHLCFNKVFWKLRFPLQTGRRSGRWRCETSRGEPKKVSWDVGVTSLWFSVVAWPLTPRRPRASFYSVPQCATRCPRRRPAAPSCAWTWPTSPACSRTASASRRARSCRWCLVTQHNNERRIRRRVVLFCFWRLI